MTASGLSLSVSAENGELIGVEWSITGSDTLDAEGSLLCVPTWQKIRYFCLTNTSPDAQTVSATYWIREDEAGRVGYAYAVALPEGTGEGTLWYDAESGAFSFVGTELFSHQTVTLDGTLTREEGVDTVTFASGRLGEMQAPLGGVQLMRRDTDRMPEDAAFTELLTMSVPEADDFVGKIGDFVTHMETEITKAAIAGYLSGLFG